MFKHKTDVEQKEEKKDKKENPEANQQTTSLKNQKINSVYVRPGYQDPATPNSIEASSRRGTMIKATPTRDKKSEADFRANMEKMVMNSKEYSKRTSNDAAFKGQKEYLNSMKEDYFRSFILKSSLSVVAMAGIGIGMRKWVKAPGSLIGGISFFSSCILFTTYCWPELQNWSIYHSKLQEIEDWRTTNRD